jgi:hypothetical protein
VQLAENHQPRKIPLIFFRLPSRTQVDRLLDPKNDITLSSMQRPAAMVGRRVLIELV